MKTLYLDHDTQIPYQDILYFEHYQRYQYALTRITVLHTFNKTYILKQSIKEIYALLNSNEFMLPHQSFIVNMAYIRIFKRLDIILDNGICIPISIKRATIVRKQFLDYIKKETL